MATFSNFKQTARTAQNTYRRQCSGSVTFWYRSSGYGSCSLLPVAFQIKTKNWVFLLVSFCTIFFARWWNTNNYGCGSYRPKNKRIRNTDRMIIINVSSILIWLPLTGQHNQVMKTNECVKRTKPIRTTQQKCFKMFINFCRDTKEWGTITSKIRKNKIRESNNCKKGAEKKLALGEKLILETPELRTGDSKDGDKIS